MNKLLSKFSIKTANPDAVEAGSILPDPTYCLNI